MPRFFPWGSRMTPAQALRAAVIEENRKEWEAKHPPESGESVATAQPVDPEPEPAANSENGVPPNDTPIAPKVALGEKLPECILWIRARLEAGPVALHVIEAEGKALGYSPSTMDRSRKAVGVVTVKIGRRKISDDRVRETVTLRLPTEWDRQHPE